MIYEAIINGHHIADTNRESFDRAIKMGWAEGETLFCIYCDRKSNSVNPYLPCPCRTQSPEVAHSPIQ